MVTCIHSSRSCLPPFYTIPIFPLFFFIYFSPFFFLLHAALTNCLRLFIVVYTLVVFISCCRNCVMYVHQLSLLQLKMLSNHFKERLPEAICCLQTCNVDVALLVMYCMYIPAFTVSSADISQL